MNDPVLPRAVHRPEDGSELVLTYHDNNTFTLSAELLRVCSPSAEIRGHGQTAPRVVSGKQFVRLTSIVPAGHYAVKLCFDDGHKSGLYTWEYLHDLCHNRQAHWNDYLGRLHYAGGSRDPDVCVVHIQQPGDGDDP